MRTFLIGFFEVSVGTGRDLGSFFPQVPGLPSRKSPSLVLATKVVRG